MGVAARLGLLWAGSRDPALLPGAAGRGSDDAKQKRRELVNEAAQRGRDVDLLGPVSLPVRCGRALHQVRLEPDGSCATPAHRGLDGDAERVAAALGGELLACLRAADGAQGSWPPPVADDGPRLIGMEAGELLAFVRVVRTWVELGYDVLAAGPALELGVAHGVLEGHLGLGMTVGAAVTWRGVSAYVALCWDAVGFTRADADLWSEQGRTLEQVEEAARSGGNIRWLARWARVVGGGVPSDALAEWAEFGLPVGVWGEAANRGLRAGDVPGWLGAGFQPVEVLRYAHLRVPLTEAVTWRDAGFTAYVATGCLGVGMTLADACELRGLPTKQVQQLWRSCGSAAAVREALAS